MKIIKELLNSYETLGGINTMKGHTLPSRQSVRQILKTIQNILFPGYFQTSIQHNKECTQSVITQEVESLISSLNKEVFHSFCWESLEKKKTDSDTSLKEKTNTFVENFIASLPLLRMQLKKDIEATFEGDPAAVSHSEVIMAYPGFHATMVYRIAHFFFQHQVPLIPRLMSEIIHSDTGIDIHPGAKIGSHFCIDHGTGLVIGETTEIGAHVKIYQGVTLGALSISDRTMKGKRHPTVEDNVTIYARTTILGGRTVIGENSVIGGNLWITKSTPANVTVYVDSQDTQIIDKQPI